MAFEDQNPNETIYTDEQTGSAAQATTAKLRVQIQGVTIGEDTLTINFTDSVSGTFDAETGVATIPITPGAQQANQNDLVGRISAGTGQLENFQPLSLTNDTTPSDVTLVGQRTTGGTELVRVDVGNLPTGGGGEVNLGANVGTGIGTFDGKTGLTLNMRSINGQGIIESTLNAQSVELDFQDTTQLNFVGRADVGTGKPTFVMASNPLFQEAFQSNLPKIVISADRALSQTSDYKRLVDLDNSSDLTITLPDPTGAQFTGLEPGHFCDIRVRSGANFAALTVAITNTFRHQNGYGTANTGLEDTIYLGYRRNRGIGQVYRLYRETDRWLFQGDYRTVESEDLTLDGPLHGGGGGTPLSTEDEGVEVEADTQTINFTGPGVTATSAGGNEVTVNIPGAAGTGGSSVYENYVVVAAGTGAAFLSAFNTAVSTQVDGVILSQNVDANDLGTTDLDVPLGRKVHIFGNGFEFISGGTAKNVGQRRFRLHGSTRWEQINFRDSALCTTLDGNTGRVEETEFIDVTTENCGNLLHHELDTAPDAGMSLGTIRLVRVRCENVRDGVHCRLGSGFASVQVPIDRVIMEDVVVDDWQRYGLNIGYDGPPSGGVWPTRSVAHITDCIVQNSTTVTGAGFAFEFTACESAELHNCWALNNSIGANNFDHEAFYSKNFNFKMIGGGAINHEQRDFQGVIGLKGKDTGAGDNSDLGHTLLYGVTVVAPSSPDINAVFIQRSNVTIESCNFECSALSGSIVGFQNGTPMINIRIINNQFECGANFNPGIVAQSDVADMQLSGNTWITQNAGAHEVIRILSGSSGGQDMKSPHIHNERFIRQGAGAMTAIDVDPRSGGDISDVDIWGCHFFDVTTALTFSGTTANATGAHRIRGCRHTGITPTIGAAPSGGTLDAALNTF
ncbi:MAG: hypothetical protein ACR2RF_14730 [Geminicoccaceae bacterium]